jgi:hypothetical protein
MIHAREDYNRRIQDIDIATVQQLFKDALELAAKMDSSICFQIKIQQMHKRFEDAMTSRYASDMPVFLVIGQDQVCADTVRAWAAKHLAAGGCARMSDIALRHADRIEEWQRRGHKPKPADMNPKDETP